MMKKPLINSYTIFLLVDFRRSELFQLQLKEQKIYRERKRKKQIKREKLKIVCVDFSSIYINFELKKR